MGGAFFFLFHVLPVVQSLMEFSLFPKEHNVFVFALDFYWNTSICFHFVEQLNQKMTKLPQRKNISITCVRTAVFPSVPQISGIWQLFHMNLLKWKLSKSSTDIMVSFCPRIIKKERKKYIEFLRKCVLAMCEDVAKAKKKWNRQTHLERIHASRWWKWFSVPLT